ncbi:AAA family ATPase [Butyrivibrio proteoclasticus]|uniref:AAA family ATPase n=1 Tax=Butyrivibrio proteoclasticus TaxID=43305 RepID=UPI00047EFBC1|nr:AAA family ATPase [Butyrivibrio proteoclasticus]
MNDKTKREIEKKINSLPKGIITLKSINGRDYEYWQYREGGKQITKRVKGEELEILKNQIEERKRLEAQLSSGSDADTDRRDNHIEDEFLCHVRLGDELRAFSEMVKDYKRRDCFEELESYLYGEVSDRVLILYGLRRTGKTTLIKQALVRMDSKTLSKAAFVQAGAFNTIADLDKDLRKLEKVGIKYVFVDEVTLLGDFIENSAILADIFASSGMKLVLSGTDSLGFLFTQDEQLYDRAVFVHTTFIPYREFDRVLGISGVDKYIQFGGTMSMGGVDYNKMQMPFANGRTTNEYVDTAIAKNIQHSLANYQYAGHFRGLTELHEKNELTNVINRIVEDINHRFVLEVIHSKFESHDLGISRNNLRKDKTKPTDILDYVDEDEIIDRIMSLLDIKDASSDMIEIRESHLEEIKSYLYLMDLIENINVRSSQSLSILRERIVFTQPGLRYSQAEVLISALLQDDVFRDTDIKERNRIVNRVLSEIRGRMLEDIVLLETKKRYPDKEVFVLQFPIGEFDMVVFDPKEITCRLYEVKHSDKAVPEQRRHLMDKDKCEYAQKQYGDIVEKCVLYYGDDCECDGVKYRNVEGYLRF